MDKPEGLTYDAWYLSLIDPISKKSKDKTTKVGCVIVDQENIPRCFGFNSFVRGINDNVPERQERPLKYFYTEHAERSAIYQVARTGGCGLKGCHIYMDFLPCTDCARAIISVGIIEIIIDGSTYEKKRIAWEERWKESMDHSKTMLREAGVKIRLYHPDGTSTFVE